MGSNEISRVVLSVDVVGLRLANADAGLRLEVLLVRRQLPPFAGAWSLPGGVLGAGERLADAARRVLVARTGLRVAHIEQLATFDDPARDPRDRSLSVAHLALLPLADSTAQAGRGVSDLAWWPLDDLDGAAPLAFDHRQIIAYAHERLRSKIDWTPLVFRLVPAPFTLPEIRRIFEAIQGQRYNDSNFRRQLLARFPGLEPVPAKDHRSNRPAQLFHHTGPDLIPAAPGNEPT